MSNLNDLPIQFVRDDYRPVVSLETLLEMAQEKVLQDAELFSDWLCAELMEPTEMRHSAYFAGISSTRLLTEVLMKELATEKQLAEGWKELRRRYLADNQDKVTSEYDRLRAEEE